MNLKKSCAVLMLTLTAFTMLPAAAEEMCYEVPRISIRTANGNGTSLKKSDGYAEAWISVEDIYGGSTELHGQVKVRGNTTSGAPKKPYTIRFDEKYDLFGMGKAKKWVLLANYFDPTLLRNGLALDLAAELGVPYTSQHILTEVWMDGKFLGCYELTEPIEVKSTRVDIDTEGQQDFLLEYESKRIEEGETYLEVGDWRFRVDEPEDPTAEQLAYMKGILQNAQNALKSNDYAKVEECMDIDSFAGFYLVNEFFKTADFGFSSVYFHYRDGKLYGGPVWDFDLAAGNLNSGYSVNYKKAVQPTGLYAAEKQFYSYLVRYETFNQKVTELYAAHYDYLEGISASGGQIDSRTVQYAAVFNRNFTDAGWKVSKCYNELMRTPDATYQKNVDYLKNWLSKRHAWMADYYGVSGSILPGDADSSGEVNATDAARVLIAAAAIGGGGAPGLGTLAQKAADVNTDGSINATDAAIILQYAAAVGAGQMDVTITDFVRH